MKKHYTLIFLLTFICNISFAADPATANKELAEQPLLFTQNKGQIADMDGNLQPDILFTTHSNGVKLFLNKNGISYQFQKTEYPEGYDATDKEKIRTAELEKKIKTTTYRMDMELVGASSYPVIETEGGSEYFENFYLAHCPNGVLNVPTFTKITYKEVYPNIDWVVYTKGDEMKYDFIVHPGGDPALIKMRYKDADAVKIAEDGSLLVTTPFGRVIDQKPVSLQQRGAKIESAFKYNEGIIIYWIGEYNEAADLIIDPSITWATYYGGSGGEVGENIAIDTSGNVYMAGYTSSTANIASGGFQNSNGGGTDDAFLLKLNSSGSRLWATYYGGTGNDSGNDVAIDVTGNVYLGGITSSATGIASGGFQNTKGGATLDADAFLAKFNSSGSRIWATYYGGSGTEQALGVVTDASGNVYLGGNTWSTTNIASGGFQNTFGGGNIDAFLVKFNSSGGRLWATYYGGAGSENLFDVAKDASGNVYLTGHTTSTANIASGGFQTTYGGSQDAFLVKYNSSGGRLWATYYGGSDYDYGRRITTDGNNNVYLTGYTASTANIASAGFQNNYGGGSYDAFLVKFNSSGGRLWATYYGDSGGDYGYDVSCDANGNSYLTGYTTSTTNIATGLWGQALHGGGTDDAFLVKFNSSGGRLWATYYGGSGVEGGYGLAYDGNYNLYMVGRTYSSNNIALNGFQNSYGGSADAYLVKFKDCIFTSISITPTITSCAGQNAALTASGGSAYVWSTGATTSTINDNPTQTTNYFVTATDVNTCTATATTTINVLSVPTVNINPTTGIICTSSATLSLVATGGGTYLWNTGATTASITATASMQGTTYTVIVTGSNGCTASANRVVARYPIVNITPAASNICLGQSSTLTVSGGDTYLWDTGEITNSITVNPTQTTTYTVTATNNTTCSATGAVTVNVNSLPSANISPATAIVCNGQNITLTASGGGTYAWSTGSITSAITVNPTQATTYTVTVTNSNSCTATTSRTVNVNNLPVVNISPATSTICTSSNTIALIASGGGTYLWSTGSTSSAISATSSQQGTTYTVVVTGSNGCTASVSRIVASNPTVSIAPLTSTICSGQSASLSATGGGSYSWNTGATSSSITVSPTLTTTYTVTVTGSNSCTATASKVVNIYSTPAVNISADGVITANDTISLGDIVQLQLNGSLNATPNIQWSPSTSINSNLIANPLVYPITTTTYSVTFVNTNGCTQSASVLVFVKPVANIGGISIATPSGTIALFDTIVLNVQLTNVTGLYGLYMKLKGDAAVSTYLTYAGYTVGSLLGTGGSIISTPPVVSSGVYDFGITKIGAVPGYTGSGVFYTFKFVTKNVTIPNGTNFCFYLDNISAYNTSGAQVGLTNQGPYCYTFTDKLNVWPGDLNNSKTVTTADLLPIGYFYNSTGPARANASLQWIAQPATLWGYGQTPPNGSAYKVFADSNGDGIISNADEAAIGFNIGKIHALANDPIDHHERALSDGDILITATPSSINPATLPSTVTLQVALKNNSGLDALYGISFNLMLDSSVFDLSSATFDYTGSIFGATAGTDFLNIQYVTDSSISIGLTRYANAAINGNGVLCRITLQTKSTLPGSVTQTQVASIIDAANTQTGDPLFVKDTVLYIPVGTNTGLTATTADYIAIYPNPAKDVIYIANGFTQEKMLGQKIRIYNYQGQLVYETELHDNLQSISTKPWGVSGLYAVEVRNSTGNIIANKKIVVE